MIRLTRAAPPPSRFRGEERIRTNLDLILRRKAGEKPAKDVWKSAKASLKAESHGKCAFCESATSTVAYGDVEHFRPSSVYWWLAYCYDNFSYCCQICNQKFKKAKFRIARDDRRLREPTIPNFLDEAALREIARAMTPDPVERATGGMPFDDFVRRSRIEKPFLVDPYVEAPEELYKWEADPTLEEVRIAARTNRVRARRALAAAEEDLGLNREELRRRRWHVYKALLVLAHIAASAEFGNVAATMATDEIKRMMSPDRDYAGMVRYFVRSEWRLDI